jgi:UDP-N-acetyl-2-amino-2-deoxyglucuronate dehydrogenase
VTGRDVEAGSIRPLLRAAIVGTGRIGSTYDDEVVDRRDPSFYRGEMRHVGLYTILPVNHAGAYTTTPGFVLAAAANRSEAKLRAFGERWGVRAVFTDFRQMLREEKPDVVSVCTRSPEKAEITIAAAEAGVRAIVVEKALATSMTEADAMIAACERTGTFLAVNHPYRFSTTVRRTKALIEAGAIGTLGVVTTFSAGGVLHGGTHTFDLLRYWAGDVVAIEAKMKNFSVDQDLPASGVLWFGSGVSGYFDHDHDLSQAFEARGTAGYLTLSALVGDGWLFRIAPLNPATPRKYPGQLTVEPVEGESHARSPTQRLFAELYQTLTAGGPFISTGRDAAKALELGLACYASHLAGGPISLPLVDRDLRVPNR